MSKKPSCINLDRDLVNIVQSYPLQVENLSSLINEFLLHLASEEEELTPSQIRARVQQIAKSKRKILLEQTKIIEPEPEIEEEKIRCWDKGQEAYAMIPVSEYSKHPEWFTVDEETAPYEVTTP